MKGHLSVKRLALLGIFTAGALVMFLVENLFPSLLVPGAKLGLSNIFTLLTVVTLGGFEAVILIIVRTALGCLIVGNIGALIYSMSAGLAGVVISVLLYRLVYPKVSLVAISVISAVIHNLVQNLIFCLITETPKLLSYMPYLALIGVLSGVTVGFTVYLLIKKIPTSVFTKILNENFLEDKSESEKR